MWVVICQVTILTQVQTEAVEHIPQSVFENISAYRSHYLVGVPHERKNLFFKIWIHEEWSELLPWDWDYAFCAGKQPQNRFIAQECGTGYHTLASNILQFSEMRCLPIPINGEKLDKGGGIAETPIQRKAKLHKSCRNEFSNMKLKIANKRSQDPHNVLSYKGVLWRNYFQSRKSCFFWSLNFKYKYNSSRPRASVARQGVNMQSRVQ